MWLLFSRESCSKARLAQIIELKYNFSTQLTTVKIRGKFSTKRCSFDALGPGGSYSSTVGISGIISANIDNSRGIPYCYQSINENSIIFAFSPSIARKAKTALMLNMSPWSLRFGFFAVWYHYITACDCWMDETIMFTKMTIHSLR